MKKGILLASLAVACGLGQSSVLSDRAATLSSAHSWTIMLRNSSLDSIKMDYSQLYYTDSGVWDPVRRQVAWVGGPGVCCVNPALFRRISYDDATDVWTLSPTPFSGGGHGYDGNALNPNTGDHYFVTFDGVVNGWNGVSWGMLPKPPGATCCVGLVWYPELNSGKGGLVYVSGNGRLAWYDGTRWTAILSPSVPWGGMELFAEYNPVLKVVWLGGGSGTGSVNYKLDAQAKLTRMKDAPVNLTNNVTLKSCDPVSGKFIIYEMRNNQNWWEYDMTADVWTQITDMKPKPWLPDGSIFHVPLPDYGVILFYYHSWPTSRVYLYRHTAVVDVEKRLTSANVGRATLQVSPSPVATVARIRLSGFSGNNGGIGVYSSDGRLVADVPVAQGSTEHVEWDASAVPAGVYVVRASDGLKQITRKILVVR